MSGQNFEELLEIKRDGRAHTAEEMDRIILGYARGEMPDYQMSAWLMATLLNGLDADETVWMTDAMVRSGTTVDLSSIPGIKVDKHSTGGVADTTTLILCPLVAACGVPVAKMSGRGLGHTGGTLDKLESIPGFRVELDPDEFLGQVREIGLAVIAQSPDVDPADKKIYALRDVTATVPSVPLIVGSIISKKVAGGADAILLDVKAGSGAFMKTAPQAQRLAQELVRVGNALGKEVVAIITDMDQPLGMAVGNSLEVIEAIETLRGKGPAALTDLCLTFAAKMLALGGVASDEASGRLTAEAALFDGSGLRKLAEWIAAQGGDARVVEDPGLLPLSNCVREVRASSRGCVAGFDTELVGRAAMHLGAGRATTDDVIDLGAGLTLDVRVGSHVEAGDRLCTMYAATEALLDEGEQRFVEAVHWSAEPVAVPPLIHDS